MVSYYNMSSRPITAPSSTSAPVATSAPPATAEQPLLPNGYRLPDPLTLQQAAKLAIVEDKQIMMDYWTSSIEKTVLIGVQPSTEKLLVRNNQEYTSPIAKIYKIASDYIIVTENSIYIVDVGIPSKKVSLNLHE